MIMDKLIPTLIMFGITLIGFLSKFLEIEDIQRRYVFTDKYLAMFIDYVDELFSKHSFNQRLYYELTLNVKEMQFELGSDGIFAYIQDNLRGYKTNNYQLLINFLPETCNVINYFNNSLMMERYIQEAQQCNDMFICHLGTLKLAEKNNEKVLQILFQILPKVLSLLFRHQYYC